LGGCATRPGWRSRAEVFNNTSSSGASGYLTFITSRNNAFGFSNALIVDAFVDLARIRSSTGLWEEFATSRCFVISDRDLTWARREDGLTFSSVDNVDDASGSGITGSSGFGTSSLGFSDFVTIEGGLFTDSGGEASSDGTGIGDAIFRAVGVWRRRDSTERLDFNAVSFIASLWASIDWGTDLGGDIFAKTSSGFTDSVSQTSISSGFRACFVGLCRTGSGGSAYGSIAKICGIITGFGCGHTLTLHARRGSTATRWGSTDNRNVSPSSYRITITRRASGSGIWGRIDSSSNNALG